MKSFQTAFTFLCLLFVMNDACGQVQFENLSFEKALKKAKKEDKILMVIMDSKACDQCNDVAKKGLASEKAIAINKLAVVIELEPTTPDWGKLSKQYYIIEGSEFGALFFTGNGVLIHRYDKSSTNGAEYLTEVSTAMQNINLPNEIEKLEQTIKENSYADLNMLDDLQKKRKSLQLSNEDLMYAFINVAPKDSLSSFRYFQLLANFAPILSSRADSIFRTNTFFHKNWYLISEKDRIAINQEVANKTWRKAVAEKDYVLESKLADFSGSIHENATAQSRSRTRIYHLQSFYKAVKDTTEFLKFAALYVDMSLMPLSLDSINQMNKKRLAVQTPIKRVDSIDSKASREVFTTTTTVFTPLYFSGQLNHFAWSFYTMSKDTADWQHALKWAKKAMDIFPTPELMDTYAQLLYVTGNHEEAILQEQHVIEEKKKAHREKDVPITERILARMQKGEAKVAE